MHLAHRAAVASDPAATDLPRVVTRPRARIDLGAAEDFLRTLHDEVPAAGPVVERLDAVRREVAATGTYRHTGIELEHGARMAWRNAHRCIGRLYWRSLRVRDLRHVGSPGDVAEACVDHLRAATNGGRIRPLISVFAPAPPGETGLRIWNPQLVRYAAYRREGAVVGDPAHLRLTEAVTSLGWTGSGGAFDVLPLVVDSPDDPPHLADVPADAVLEVPLTHPELAWFAELGLRWHAVPAISSMPLEIGGVVYPAAPFNGWYMGTEIGARNLADTDRYDLLPTVARRMGLDTSSPRTMWKDRALVELNVAVLHSFDAAGVALADHHTESARFLTHLEREETAGRRCPADWSWIVPPVSGGATPVFHRYYDEGRPSPRFLSPDHAFDPVAAAAQRPARRGRHRAGCVAAG